MQIKIKARNISINNSMKLDIHNAALMNRPLTVLNQDMAGGKQFNNYGMLDPYQEGQ